ncbi:hypothetical protein JQ615_18100 [Bradyrhizobium jicamae]|uniref:Uncharacterized protein n=1 Tax=Bradyrhizobium jicamae TaxID=280332 RepID=A0ABS5FKU4_9BRAD|nr:hypothetical protein [Bradyrhizobium jicamae]MBR0797304.1 hypothetical protein [Bradyrhizobium jicamae]
MIECAAPTHRRPNATRVARHRRELVAELTAELGRQPTTTDQLLIAAAADLALKQQALQAAQARGEPVDDAAALKVAGLLNRCLATLRRGAGRKSVPRILDRIAAEQRGVA